MLLWQLLDCHLVPICGLQVSIGPCSAMQTGRLVNSVLTAAALLQAPYL